MILNVFLMAGEKFAGVWSYCALVHSWEWGLQGEILLILGRSGIGDGDGFLLMLGPEWVEAGCDFGFSAGDEPVAVGEGGLGA